MKKGKKNRELESQEIVSLNAEIFSLDIENLAVNGWSAGLSWPSPARCWSPSSSPAGASIAAPSTARRSR